MHCMRLLTFTALISLLVTQVCYAELTLSKIFSDHMVLQRDQATRIWGWSTPNTDVEVCLINKCYDTQVDETGAWQLHVDPQPALGPIEIQVKNGNERISLKDLYFGDVWLAGGQSNMGWTLNQGVDNQQAEIADGNYPLIRTFDVEERISPTQEQKLTKGSWVVASPETVGDFSAVAWFFAKKYHIEKEVAVGIISSNWGGTPAEAWVSVDALKQLPIYNTRTKEAYKDIDNLKQRIALNQKNEAEKYRRLFNVADAVATKAHSVTFNDKHWQTVDFPSSTKFTDVLWLRKSFELESVPKAGVVIDFGDLLQVAHIFLNEELIATEDWNTFGSRHQIPASKLKKGKNLISIRLANAWFNRLVIGEKGDMHVLAGGNKIPINTDWRYSNIIEAPLPQVIAFQSRPSFLYNAMIHPIRKMNLSGVLWYQGESNVGDAPLYGGLFKALIQDWRDSFDRSDLPFLFVQIAGYAGYGKNNAAAELRNQQASALSLENTAMATAIDLGNEMDIHPRNKQDVAQRLWLNAKKIVFGDKVVHIAPSVVTHTVNKSNVLLKFDSTLGGLVNKSPKKPLTGFELAGKSGRFYEAKAVIRGHTIIITSDKVKQPHSVRYAWSQYPEINLYSEHGLPVIPFKIEEL